MKEQTFTKEQISEAAQSALDNWDWDQEPKAESMKHNLEHLRDHPQEQTIGQGFTDIWDWLHEFAISH